MKEEFYKGFPKRKKGNLHVMNINCYGVDPLDFQSIPVNFSMLTLEFQEILPFFCTDLHCRETDGPYVT